MRWAGVRLPRRNGLLNPRMPKPGLSHHQEFALVKDLRVVVQSPLRLEPLQLTRVNLASPSQLRSVRTCPDLRPETTCAAYMIFWFIPAGRANYQDVAEEVWSSPWGRLVV